jgi:hypothetical protein
MSLKLGCIPKYPKPSSFTSSDLETYFPYQNAILGGLITFSHTCDV